VGNKPLKWIISLTVLALALTFAVVCWVIGNRMTAQAEAKLQENLQDWGLADKVRWGNLKVSPLGAFTFNNLRIELMEKIYIEAQQVRISDVLDKPERQRIRLQLKQAKVDFSEMPINGYREYGLVASFDLNPLDLDLQLDWDFARNQAEIIYHSQQEDMADIELQLNLSQIEGLHAVRKLLPELAAAYIKKDDNIVGLNLQKAIDLNWLEAVVSIHLDLLQGRIKNRGMVKRAMTPWKMIALMEMVDNNPPATIKQSEQALLKKVADIQASCHQGIETLKPSCERLVDFALEKRQSLHLTIAPAKPLSAKALMEQLKSADSDMERVLAALKLLNLRIK